MLTTALALTLATMVPAPAQKPQAQQPTASITADTCPVTGKIIPVGQGVKAKIRNREYLVFDAEAAEELKANPDKYLEADGTPKSHKKTK